jgi:hypothetical protein
VISGGAKDAFRSLRMITKRLLRFHAACPSEPPSGQPAEHIRTDVKRQPLTAPVNPPTMRRWAMVKKMSVGSIDSAVKAKTFAVSAEYCD